MFEIDRSLFYSFHRQNTWNTKFQCDHILKQKKGKQNLSISRIRFKKTRRNTKVKKIVLCLHPLFLNKSPQILKSILLLSPSSFLAPVPISLASGKFPFLPDLPMMQPNPACCFNFHFHFFILWAFKSPPKWDHSQTFVDFWS